MINIEITSCVLAFLRQFGNTVYPYLWIRIPFEALCSLVITKTYKVELPGAMSNGLLEFIAQIVSRNH